MIKLTQLMNESEEKRPLSLEVKKHFLEIVSTYNKYQESMDRKSDIAQIAETLGGITEAARTLAIHEAGDWFDKHTVKRNMMELDKLGKQFDKVALEARALDQRMGGLYEDMGHILSRYYKIGEISEEQMKQRLGIKESAEDCGCGCNGTTEGGCNESVNERQLKGLDGIDSKTPLSKISDTQKLKIIQGTGNNISFKVPKGFNRNFWQVFSKGKIKKKKSLKGEIVYYLPGKFIDSPSFKSVKDLINGVDWDSVQRTREFNESVNEQAVVVSKRTENGNIVSVVKEVTDLNEQETALYEFGKKFETLMEKNCPTDSGKWSSYKSQAKKKFDVYPSAYANGWAAKKYKSAGGGWKKC